MVLVVIATICALAWMCYRVSTLLNIPIPTLVKLLGLDLPAPPRVSLHGISSDTITLHWSVPEKAGTVAKHIIQINGINVGESEKRGATSVTVTGLNPNQRYNARVIAANAQNFQAPGQLIRLRTRRRSQGSVSGTPTRGDVSDEVPTVHAAVESVPPSPQQQGRHGHGSSKRTAKERRNSPAALEQVYGGNRGNDEYTVESLTADLDGVRNEITETEAQLAVAEEEFKATEAELRSKLDELKQKKNEEDAARQRIKAETKSLEEARRSAEATRSRTEKALKAKEYEIKRMQDDISRWEAEKVVAQEKVQELKTAAEESKDNAATTEKELGSDIREAQSQICNIEEEIRHLVSTIKTLEQQYERLKQLEEQEARQVWEDNEKEAQWKDRQRNLEFRYMQIYNAYQAAELEYIKSQEALIAHRDRRGSGSGPGSGADSITKKHKSRRNRNRKSRQNLSPFAPQDPRVSEPYFLGATAGYQQLSPTFSNSNPGPFFNYAVTSPTEIPDMDAGTIMDLTGGAPMSPTADALLPSNLFSFDDNPPSPKPSSTSPENASLDMVGGDGFGQLAPQSPLSSGSVSQSTSPRSSLNHFPLFPTLSNPNPNPNKTTTTSENMPTNLSPIGSNRPGSSSQSLHDENAPPHLNGGRKFVRLFSNSLTPFTRQRGKTLPHDGLPPIGSLRPSENHSFPKNDPPGLDPIGTRRRSGSYGSWTGSIDFVHHNSTPLQRADSTASRRSATLNQFNPSFDPIDPHRLFDGPTSPRPLSIGSFDQHFPAPSSDVSAAFGWPAAPPGLTAPAGSNRWMSHSRPVSRPVSPNAANISTTSLSLLPRQSHPLASYFSSAPRLNPAAPTFQARSGNLAVGNEENIDPSSLHVLDRADSLSIKTDTSALTASTTGTSGASLEMVPTKESILSRFSALSRKGSTGKFNISWKKEKSEKDKEKEKDRDTAVIFEGESSLLDPSSAVISPPSATPTSRHLWQPWRKAEGDISADEKEHKDEKEKDKKDKKREKEKDDDKDGGTSTPMAKESTSPWLKSTQSAGNFFGTIGLRKTTAVAAEKKDDDTAVGVAGEVEDDFATPIVEQPSEKKGLGIFGRRSKTDKKEDREKDKGDKTEEVAGEA